MYFRQHRTHHNNGFVLTANKGYWRNFETPRVVLISTMHPLLMGGIYVWLQQYATFSASKKLLF